MRKLSKSMFVLLTVALCVCLLTACDLFGGNKDGVGGADGGTTIKSYKIVFDYNGGFVDGMTQSEELTVTAANYVITEPTYKPRKAGENFRAWYKSKDAADKNTTSEIWDFTKTIEGKSVTLYAGWAASGLSTASEIDESYFQADAKVKFDADATEFDADGKPTAYSKVNFTAEVTNDVISFNFNTLASSLPSGASYAVYGRYVENNYVKYISDGVKWRGENGTIPSSVPVILNDAGVATNAYGATRVSLAEGSNVFKVIVYAEDTFVSTIYTFVINRAEIYRVTFVNGSNRESVTFNAAVGYNPPQHLVDVLGYESVSEWFYIENGVEKPFVPGVGENATVVKSNLTVFAKTKAKDFAVKITTPIGFTLPADAYDDNNQLLVYTYTYNTIPADLPVPSKYQASFAGWAVTGSNTLVTDGHGKATGYWKITSDTTIVLRPTWTMNKYTLTVNNTNTDAGTTTPSQTIEYGGSYTVEATPKVGYSFVGWSTTGTTAAIVSANLSYTFDFKVADETTQYPTNKVLFALWEENTYRVTVKVTGDDTLNDAITNAEIAGKTFSEDVLVSSATAQMPVAYRSAHNFMGWYFTYTLDGVPDAKYLVSAGDGIIDIEELVKNYKELREEENPTEFILSPLFEKRMITVNITTNSQDINNLEILINDQFVASSNIVNKGDLIYDFGTVITVIANTTDKTNVFTVFKRGGEEGEDVLDGFGNPHTSLNENLENDFIIYAQFDVPSYSIEYREATNPSVTIKKITIAYNENFSLGVPDAPAGLNVDGIFFAYYYIKGQEDVPFTDEFGKGNLKETSDVIVYAKWEYKRSTLKVSQNITDAGTIEVNSDDGYGVYRNDYRLTATQNVGYNFDGWFILNAEGNLDKISTALSCTISMPANEVEYWAMYTPRRYAVTFLNTNGVAINNTPYWAIFGTQYIVKTENGDPTNSDQLVSKVDIAAWNQYTFAGWSVSYEENTKLITNTDGVLTEAWSVPAKTNLVPVWESIFKFENGIITGISDYGKANFVDVTIPSTINGFTVTGIGAYAFEDWSALKTVKISSLVLAIGDGAFRGCTGLTSVSFTEGTDVDNPDSALTSLGSYAFKNCVSLTSLYLPVSVTNWGVGVFANCNAITRLSYAGTIALGRLFNCDSDDAETVALIQNSLSYNIPKALNNIVFIDGTTNIAKYAMQNVKGMTFSFANTIKSIGQSAFEGSDIAEVKITDVKDNFEELLNLTSIGLNCFKGTGLTTVQIPEKLTSIGTGAFSNCLALTKVTFAITTTKVTNAAFSGCTNLLTLLNTGTIVSIEDSAFSGCTSLVCFGNPADPTAESNVTNVNDKAFKDCPAFTATNILANFKNIENIGYLAFDIATLRAANEPVVGKVYYSSECDLGFTGDVDMSISPKYQNITMIAKKAFANNLAVTSIVLPNSLQEIGESAFQGATALTKVSVYFFGAADDRTATYNLFQINNNAFFGCTALTEVILPKTVTIINPGAFSGCSILADFNLIAENVEWIRTTDEIAKDELGQNITVKDADGNDVTDEEGNLLYVYVTEQIYFADYYTGAKLPDDMTARDDTLSDFGNILTIGEAAFKNTRLDGVLLPATLSKLRKEAFMNISALKSLDIIDGACKIISDSAFEGCNQLKNFTLNKTITEIGARAFYGAMLEKFEIEAAAALKTIGEYAFAGAPAVGNTTLKSVVLSGSTDTVAAHAFENNYALETFTASGLSVVNDYLLYNCKNLTSASLADGLQKIGNYSFYNCARLSRIDEDEEFANTLKNIGDSAFEDCRSLFSHKFSELSTLETIGSKAFYRCTQMDELFIPASVISIGNEAYMGCINIGSLTFGVDSKLTEIAYSAFANNSSIQYVTLPDGITAIQDKAFFECSNLIMVEFGTQLATIGDMAFMNCSREGDAGLVYTNYTFYGAVAPVLADTSSVFGTLVDGDFKCASKFYVKKLYLNEFKTAPSWVNYAGATGGNLEFFN